MSSGTPPSLLERLQGSPVNIAVVAGVAIVLVAGAVFAFVIQPGMNEAQIKKNWTSPEAAAQRGPGKKINPAFEQAVRTAAERAPKAAAGSVAPGGVATGGAVPGAYAPPAVPGVAPPPPPGPGGYAAPPPPPGTGGYTPAATMPSGPRAFPSRRRDE